MRARTAYLADFLLGSVFYALILYVFVQLWSVLGRTRGFAVEGFGPRELVWYLMASEAIMLGRARFEQETDEEVKTGAIAYCLNKPYHYILFKLASYWGETALKMTLNIVIGAAVALAAVGPISVRPAHLCAVLVCAALALTLNFFIGMALGLSAFWVEDTAPFFWIYSKVLFVLGGLFAPMEVYPDALARTARATPFNYVLYAPARLFVQFDMEFFLRAVTMQVVWVAALAFLVMALYRMGVRRLDVNGG
jgi:ABC-2 type transport system permease protein